MGVGGRLSQEERLFCPLPKARAPLRTIRPGGLLRRAERAGKSSAVRCTSIPKRFPSLLCSFQTSEKAPERGTLLPLSLEGGGCRGRSLVGVNASNCAEERSPWGPEIPRGDRAWLAAGCCGFTHQCPCRWCLSGRQPGRRPQGDRTGAVTQRAPGSRAAPPADHRGVGGAPSPAK